MNALTAARGHVERRVPDVGRSGHHRPTEAANLVVGPHFDLDVIPRGQQGIERRDRPGDVEGHPMGLRCQRAHVSADLVGRVTVGRHPVAADDKARTKVGESVGASVEVQNTGSRGGDEVVQLFTFISNRAARRGRCVN